MQAIKLIQLLTMMLLAAIISVAQRRDNNDTLKKNDDPLPSRAFNKMVIQDITYAIVGENTPVSGLKIDISKPEGTISGTFASKHDSWVPWSLLGFEFKGGITDKNFSIFKGLSGFNSAFEFKPSFYFIFHNNSAEYGGREDSLANKLIVRVKNGAVSKNAKSVIDTFYVAARIFNHHLDSIKPKKETLPPGRSETDTVLQKIAIHLIKKVLNKDTLNVGKKDATLTSLIDSVPMVRKKMPLDTYNDNIEALYRKYQKQYKGIDADTLNKMIVNTGEIWTLKRYNWYSISPFARTEKINKYHNQYEGKDSSYFKSDYHFYYGITGNANLYFVKPNKIAFLLRAGITLSHMNNLTALSSYNYETRNPLFSYGSSVTEKTKSGSAYNHSDIKSGFVKQINLEYYVLPLRSMVPGFYFSSNVNHSSIYKLPSIVGRENDKLQFGMEGGPVFNISSRDRENSILSILFYLRYEDLTDKRRTNLQTGIKETRDDLRNRNMNIGVRVGIPIYLPLRSNK